MVLQLRTTHRPASDLGYLLHKNPSKVHEAELPFGKAFLAFPEATDEACTAAIILDIDPVGLVRGKSGRSRWADYVNDRPYVASSFMSSAIVALCRTAMTGRSKERPELAQTAIPLEVTIPSIRCKGGDSFLRALFGPLGYMVEAARIGLDPDFPEWGEGSLFSVRLSTTKKISEVLNHLCVLLPVLDDDKHYWVSKDEIEKLLSKGEDWLAQHPEREEIARRYLLRQKNLLNLAIEQLETLDGSPEESAEPTDAAPQPERGPSLHDLRLDAVEVELVASHAKSVLDLGCGEGKLLRRLLKRTQFEKIVGMDVCLASLDKAARYLRLNDLSDRQRERIKLVHGSLTYVDTELGGFDAAALVEVIEHLDIGRLKALEASVFGHSKPQTVVLTTPNKEYNALFETMPAESMRHWDHRFEWTRKEFSEWASRVAADFGYMVTVKPVGIEDPTHGAPSQMAVFTR